MRQVVQAEGDAGNPHGVARGGREAARVRRVRQEVLPQEVAQPAHKGEAHAGDEAVPVPPL